MAESFNPVEIGEVDANGKLTLAAGNDLDTLRPEVQAAMRTMDGQAGGNRDDAYDVIEAELLRLAGENAQLHESAQGGYEDGWHALRNERDTLRAELAALKATIAGSNVGIITQLVTHIGSETHDSVYIEAHRVPFNDLEIAQTVRLVVEK